MRRILTLIIAGIGATLASAALAQDQKTEGRLTSELTFQSIDTQSKGYIHQGDLEEFRESVFAGMDLNDDHSVTFQEFITWDPGFSNLAETKKKTDAYQVALRVVFAFWDRDGDDRITTSEMRHAMNADFRRADLNDDAILSENEFLNGFTIIVAVKAAFRPDL